MPAVVWSPPADAGTASAAAAGSFFHAAKREARADRSDTASHAACDRADRLSALSISVKTIEAHRANIMRKLHLRSVSDLVRYAIRNTVVPP